MPFVARTVTTINTSTAIGDTGHIGEAYLITKTSLQLATCLLQLEAQLTNGAMPGVPSQAIRLRWSVSSLSLAASAVDAVAKLAGCSHAVDLIPSRDSGGIRITQTPIVPAIGTYLYTWFEAPTLNIAAAVVLSSTEYAQNPGT